MAEKKYIEREAVLSVLDEAVKTWRPDIGISKDEYLRIRYKNLPTVDVRPVVLCKDCMYAPSGTDGGEDQGFSLEWPHNEWTEDNPCPCKCEDGWYSHKPKPDFFCANGKREES